jgi:hypothetical protein
VVDHWDGAADRAGAISVAVEGAAALAVAADAGSTARADGRLAASSGQPMSLHTDTTSDGWRAAGRAAAIDRWPR